MARILSLCTSAGLWDRALIDAGHTVVAGCELMPHKRAMYKAWCGGEHLCADLNDLPEHPMVQGQDFDGVIGGIPCQTRSVTRAMRPPKFPDLLGQVVEVLKACTWRWCVLENVRPLSLAVLPPGFQHVAMNAMSYAQPHQSRLRHFTYRGLAKPPAGAYPGNCDDLKAYPVVAAKIYGPKRGAWLQGWPEFAKLPFPCLRLQEALADGVPRCLAAAWLPSIAGA